MSKPIFIVRIPRRDFLGEIEMLDKLRHDLKNQLTDYHVLIVADSVTDKSEFECYNADDATEANIKEIQDKVFEILKQNETDSNI
jgi:translation elongation factor EF-Tu-like GTPase